QRLVDGGLDTVPGDVGRGHVGHPDRAVVVDLFPGDRTHSQDNDVAGADLLADPTGRAPVAAAVAEVALAKVHVRVEVEDPDAGSGVGVRFDHRRRARVVPAE